MKRLVRWAAPVALVFFLGLAGIAVAQTEVNITNFRVTLTPDGVPLNAFPSGLDIVYVGFDYSEAAETQIQVRVFDPKGQVLFQETKVYNGSGSELYEVPAIGLDYPDGVYLANIYVGTPPLIVQSVEWTVGQPAPPPPPASTAVLQIDQGAGLASEQAGVASAVGGLSTPIVLGMLVLLILLAGLVVWAIRGFLSTG